jgi:hypothetical protein
VSDSPAMCVCTRSLSGKITPITIGLLVRSLWGGLWRTALQLAVSASAENITLESGFNVNKFWTRR